MRSLQHIREISATAASNRSRSASSRTVKAVPASAAAAAAAAAGLAPLTLDDVLARCRDAVGEGLASMKGAEVIVHGTGNHLGSPVAWSLRFRRDGAFYEEIRSKYLTFKWGYNGSPDSTCWEVDPAGVAKHLEYDDHESMLLALLVRSGCWLDREAMQGRLQIRALHIGGQCTHANMTREGSWTTSGGADEADMQERASSGASASTSAASGAGVNNGGGGSHSLGDSSGSVYGAGQASSSSSSSSSIGPSAGAVPKSPARRPAKRMRRMTVSPSGPGTGVKQPVYIDIALTGTKMLARVELCPDTFRPLGFGQALVGWDDGTGAAPTPCLWVFEDWRLWEAGAQTATSGGGGGSSYFNNNYQQQELDPGAPPSPAAAAMRHGALHSAARVGSLAADSSAPRPPGVYFPARVRHNATAGGAHYYSTTKVKLQRVGPGATSVAYTIPLCTKLPVDASFDRYAPAGTWAWKAPSGHIVVRVQVNGMQPGYMLLDTGASGFVLNTGLAARYGLTRFGKLHIAGLTGKIHTCFCRASGMRLGPLVVRDPVFMEMNVEGLVRGLEPGIIGIAGYDVFRRAIFEFPTPEETWRALAQIGVEGLGLGEGVGEQPQQPSAADSTPAPAGGPAPACGGYGAGGGDASDVEQMRAFDAGELAPLQRQLTGTAHAATLAQPAEGCGGGGAARWDGGGGGGVSVALPPCPPVPVPGMHPAAPGQGLKPLWLMIHNPETPPEYSSRFIWHPMRLIGNLPHAEITFKVPGGPEHTALFMIDSGAGGADLLFHGRSSREMGLVTADELAGRGDRSRVRSVRGVGGDGQAPIKVVLGELEWADWGGVRFEKVRALFSLKGGLDISLYSAGIIGADLINRRRVVIDYPNKRVGILAE